MDIKSRDVGNVVVLDIDGEITRPITDAVQPGLHLHVKSQLDLGKKNILLNFAGVDFIDSFGVGEILASFISTHNLGGKINLERTSKKLTLVLTITGLVPNVFQVYDDETSALQSFAKF
jgi:anti-anti-sigma factor